MTENLKVNFGNHCTNKKFQTTPLNVANKVTGDGHVLKEASHTKEDKTKGSTHIYITEAKSECFEEEHRTGEYKESDTYVSVKSNLRKAPFSLQNAMKTKEKVCDILEYGYQLRFLYTP